MVAKVSMGLIPPPFWIKNSAELSNSLKEHNILIHLKTNNSKKNLEKKIYIIQIYLEDKKIKCLI